MVENKYIEMRKRKGKRGNKKKREWERKEPNGPPAEIQGRILCPTSGSAEKWGIKLLSQLGFKTKEGGGKEKDIINPRRCLSGGMVEMGLGEDVGGKTWAERIDQI